MVIKIISISILLTILMVKIRADGEKEDKFEQCRVFSPKYQTYMLAIKYLWFIPQPSIFGVDLRSFLDKILRRESKIEYSEIYPRAVWTFEPVMNRKGAYYLRNQEYSDDYLKGSSSYVELIFKENFHVCATKKNDDLDEVYMWKFNKTSTNSDRYYIWNLQNGSPLHTRRVKYVNVVSLFDGSIGVNSKSFEWVIKCKDDLVPRYIGF